MAAVSAGTQLFQSEQLEFDMTVFLVSEYAALPLALAVIHRMAMKEVPKKEMFFLFCCITTWSWVGVFVVIFGTNFYCSQDYCGPFRGLSNTSIIISMIILSSVSFTLTLLEPLMGWSITCGLTNNPQPLPVEFKPSPVDFVRDITDRIIATGPTLIAGHVVEDGAIKYNNGKTSFWKLGHWGQFFYHSWVNDGSDLNLKDQGFDDLEEVFSYPKPLVIKIFFSVFPANEESKANYNRWLNELLMMNGSPSSAKMFTEELVTDQTFWKKHNPSRLVPSAQLPSLVQQRTAVTNLANKPVLDHVVLAKDRLICEDQPCWMNRTAYAVATVFLLGPVFRIFYWLSVRVVRLHYRKLFNTEEGWTSDEEPSPFVNNIEGFRLKRFT